MDELILKHTLKNELEHGKASAKAVISKVLGEDPSLRKRAPEVLASIEKVIEKVSKMSEGEKRDKLAELWPDAFEREDRERKFVLPGVEQGKVVTRFLPEPNAYLHIGHAKAAWLSRELADQYGGKCLLRFDDTNPENEEKEFVGTIGEDLKWLGLEFDGESFTSDMMPQLYEVADKFVASGDAYVCGCTREEISKSRRAKKGCACRERDAKEGSAMWERMKKGEYKQGEAILRLKADMGSKNTVMRDPSLFRVIDAPHYRQGTKYRAWPTYDFEVSISDSLAGVTHAMRSKEYELRDELYYYIVDKAGLRKPHVHDFARLNIRGTVLSKRLLRPLIEGGKVSGYDDPRLPTVRGLKRRGITPEAIKSFVLSFGIGKMESEPGWDKLFAENRKVLDASANRYFFAPDAVRLVVKGAPETVAELNLHPTFKERGTRGLKTMGEFYIAGSDASKLKKGEEVRLKDLYNIRVTGIGKEMAADYIGNRGIGGKKIQWVPIEGAVEIELHEVGDLFVDGEYNPESLKITKGFAENNVEGIKDGGVVQFERVGFARKDGEKRFILAHR